MKLKYVALINIMGIIFSSFSPVFADTQSDILAEREKRVKEQAVILSDKSVNLDDKEKELNRKKAELDDFEKKVHEDKVEFSVRAKELDDKFAKLNYDSENLVAQNKELQDAKTEVENYRASVEKQAEEAERMKKDAAEQMRLANIRKDNALKVAREIRDMENKLANERKQIIAQKQENERRGNKLAGKENELNLREEELNIAQAKLDKDKEDVEADWAKIAAERKEADKVRSEAEKQIEEAELKIQKAEAIERWNNELLAKIGSIEVSLQAKTNELLALQEKIENTDNRDVQRVIVDDSRIIDWSKGLVRAKGLGIAPPNTTKAQGKALARRAAIADLYRNLLETVQGVQIDSKTTVESYMVKSDVIHTAVEGTIRGVEIEKEEYNEDEESYTIEGYIQQGKLADVMSKILANIPVPKRPKEAKVKTGGEFTGLIVDARNLVGLQERRAMRIVDEKGVAVYGVEFADRNLQARIGLCEYYKEVLHTDDEVRVGNNPLMIEAQRLSNSNEDIVIPMEAAEAIRNNKIDFRKDCKVIVVRS